MDWVVVSYNKIEIMCIYLKDINYYVINIVNKLINNCWLVKFFGF